MDWKLKLLKYILKLKNLGKQKKIKKNNLTIIKSPPILYYGENIS
jgi:hypothetical protein